MLFKRDTETAREARLEAATGTFEGGAITGLSSGPLEPSREQLEIERLNHENEALRRELSELRQDMDAAIEVAESKAREEAALAHVRNDAARMAELKAALLEARRTFEASLLNDIEAAARTLAAEALSRLVAPAVSDHEWLARAIARRLGNLRSQSVVSLQLPSGMEQSSIDLLKEQLPQGATVNLDQALRPGTARIALRLGEVEIDLACGAAKVIAQLGELNSDA